MMFTAVPTARYLTLITSGALWVLLLHCCAAAAATHRGRNEPLHQGSCVSDWLPLHLPAHVRVVICNKMASSTSVPCCIVYGNYARLRVWVCAI